MKKVYVRPVVAVEDFRANEYISACWGVGCDTNTANNIESELGNRPAGGHQPQYCGQASHQFIVTGGNNTPQYMQEEESPFGGVLYCTLYTDDTYTVSLDITTVEPGDTIYWTTTGTMMGQTSTYHHVGTVQPSKPGYPNHS